MSRTVGTMIARLTATTAQFRREMTAAQNSIRKTQQTAENASTAIAATMGVIGVAAGVAASAAVKMAAQWEHTEIAFASMLKSGETARDFLAELADFVAHTPFEMPGMVDASRRLLAFGFEMREIIPVMTSVGDAVAAMGGGAFEIDRITRALGQMYAKGRVTSQEMSLQLTEAGIPAWEYLAEAIGTSVPEAMRRVEQRLIPATVGVAAVLEGMTRDFGGSMDVMSKTTIGLWSTALDYMRITAQGLGAYLIDALGIRPLLYDLGNAFRNVGTEIARAQNRAQAMRDILSRTFTPGMRYVIIGIAGAIAGALAPAFKATAIAIWKATLALGPFMLKGAAVAIAAYAVYQAWLSVGRGIAVIGAAIVRVVASVVRVLGALFPPLRRTANQMDAYADRITAATKPVADLSGYTDAMARNQQAAAGSGTQAAKAQEELGKATERAARRAGKNIMAFDQVHQLQEDMAGTAAAPEITLPDIGVGAIAGLAMPDIAMPDIAGVTGPLENIAKAWNNFSNIVERSRPILQGIGYIIAVLGAKKLVVLAARAGRLALAWLKLRTEAGILAKVLGAAKLVFGAISIKVGLVVAAVAGLAYGAYMLVKHWDTVKTVLAETWNTIKATAITAWDALIAFFGTTVPTRLQSMVDWFKMLPGKIGKFLTDLATQTIPYWIGFGIGTMLRLTIAGVIAVVGWFQGLPGRILAFLIQLATGISARFTAIRTRMTEIIGAAINAVVGFFAQLPGRVWTFLVQLPGRMIEAGTQLSAAARTAASNMITGFMDFVSRLPGRVWDALMNLRDTINRAAGSLLRAARTAAESLWRGFKRGLGISSPSYLEESMTNIVASSRSTLSALKSDFRALDHLRAAPKLAVAGGAGYAFPRHGQAGGHGVATAAPANDAAVISNAIYAAFRDAMRAVNTERGGGETRQEIVLELEGVKVGRVMMPILRAEETRMGMVVTT